MVVIVTSPTLISALLVKQGNAIKICLNGGPIDVFFHGCSMNDGYCARPLL